MLVVRVLYATHVNVCRTLVVHLPCVLRTYAHYKLLDPINEKGETDDDWSTSKLNWKTQKQWMIFIVSCTWSRRRPQRLPDRRLTDRRLLHCHRLRLELTAGSLSILWWTARARLSEKEAVKLVHWTLIILPPDSHYRRSFYFHFLTRSLLASLGEWTNERRT